MSVHNRPIAACLALVLALALSCDLLAQPTRYTTLRKASFDDIIKNYLFIADFNLKEETRLNSKHIFWKYPIKIPDPKMPIYFDLDDSKKELPLTKGSGRVYQHLNEGRRLFLLGRYKEARDVWLTARKNFGKEYPHHRRNDYFIALSFLKLAQKALQEGKSEDDPVVKTHLANAATFLNWALLIKKDLDDPLFLQVAPKQFYNISAIYFNYGRYAGAYGTATEGLNFLRAHGLKDYRPHLRRILAEAHIKNRSYLEAVKEIDTALRQDPNPQLAASFFSRVGDIYFDLNNYELAEEMYAIANRIDELNNVVTPYRFVLTGEALFWLGKFKQAQKSFYFALNSNTYANATSLLSDDYMAIAQLRIADCYLAIDMLAKAKLQYFNVQQEYRQRLEGKIARIRHACLELPHFQGHNIQHARKDLEAIRLHETGLPLVAMELAWACEVGSYAQHERSEDMVKRVKEFYQAYPQSQFLASLIEPVRQTKEQILQQLINDHKTYQALSYFETARSLLYPQKVPIKLQKKLFKLYVEVYKPEKAAEFYRAFKKEQTKPSDKDLIIEGVFLSEMASLKKQKYWVNKSQQLGKKLIKHPWTIEISQDIYTYLQRILLTQVKNHHTGWIYLLVQAQKNAATLYTCDLTFNLLTSLLDLGTQSLIPKNVLQNDLNAIITSQFPKLLAQDENCGIGYLELEAKALQDNPIELATRYLNRRDWALSPTLTKLFWRASEAAAKAGELNTAQELWRIIKDKAPPGSPEVSYAKIRLDNKKTEYEKLWQ